jgi:hypothetical protein
VACASVGHFFSSNRSPASQLALLCNPFTLLVQILDPIFQLAVGALWKTCGYHVGPAGGILAALSWPISHDLADSEFVGVAFAFKTKLSRPVRHLQVGE